MGVLSLVFWSLTVVISLKYLSYVMRADNKGEGGILALMAVATRKIQDRRALGVVYTLGLIGATLLYGDSVITPAISVLSAVEGLSIATPAFDHFIIPITIGILVALFLFQYRGTAGLGAIFGPITFIWFVVIALMGVVQIAHFPGVIAALNPAHALHFLITNQWRGFLVLGGVFLVVTGGEALYADMGHFGRKPIAVTWYSLVGPSLVLNYFGQGALLLTNPAATENPFYLMAPSWALYPLVVLASVATIIASQAVISGAFSLTRQAIMLGFLPRLRVLHTSSEEIGQIYVPAVNAVLMIGTISLVLGFKSSAHLAAAYGIAVTTTMVITTLLAFIVSHYVWRWNTWFGVALTASLLVPDLAFFGANIIKIAHGGWFPLTVAGCIAILMMTWKRGRTQLNAYLLENSVNLSEFYELMRIDRPARVPGSAVYMTGTSEGTPPALMRNYLHNRVLHENNVLLTVTTEEIPRVSEEDRIRVHPLDHGFVRVIVRYGFLEEPHLLSALSKAEIPGYLPDYASFFVGSETILPVAKIWTVQGIWKRLFALMARNAQKATAFFHIPPDQVIELGSQINF
jgi:KUP system potassium uptake protein